MAPAWDRGLPPGPTARCGRLATAMVMAAGATAAFARQPNPPTWPASVQVFRPSDDPGHIAAAVGAAFAENGGSTPTDHGQFSTSRYAFLFEPGTYKVDIPVGYYTQVLGLGLSPQDVVFDSPRGVFSEEGDKTDLGGALSTFWRGAENFRTTANMLWAVSQAAPLRRIMVDRNLALAQYVQGVGMGYSSGGFVGNVRVGGQLQAGSQQQFCTRNADLNGGVQGGVWNMVFLGSPGAPESHCGQGGGFSGTTTVGTTPVIAEKPFVTIDAMGRYSLQVPDVRHDRAGADFSVGRSVDFSFVYVAKPTDSAAAINAHLAAGEDVVLAPGIYSVDEPLFLQHDRQVLLGLGLATLVSAQGNCVVYVGDVDGARVAGVLLEAGPFHAQVLLQWGDGKHAGTAEDPGFLHDVFARVGGSNDPAQQVVGTEVMVRIASGHVVGDNLWLWRADHDLTGLVRGGTNPCRTGLVVTGDDVTMYGLAVEHTLGDLVQWSGNRGRTFFYQSELPYDVTQAYGDAGYVGYRVNDTVAEHQALGVGVYHFFRDFDVVVERGIAAPPWLANAFVAPLSVYLTGRGEVSRVLNDRGNPTHKGRQVDWSCEKGPEVAYTPTAATTATEGAGHAEPSKAGDDLQFLSTLGGRRKPSAAGSGKSSADEVAGPPWWVVALAAQSVLLLAVAGYAMLLRCRLSGLAAEPQGLGAALRGAAPPGSPAGQSLRFSTQSGQSGSVRLRGLAALTSSFSGASPAAGTPGTGRSNTARSLRASPAASDGAVSAFGARSPFRNSTGEEYE